MVFENVGNDLRKYKHKPLQVTPQGLVTSPNLVLKLYTMLPARKKVNVEGARKFLEEEIRTGEIEPGDSGMGFTIVSAGVINSSVWGLGGELILPKTYLCSFEDGNRNSYI